MLSFVLSIRSLFILSRHFYLLCFTLNSHKYFMSFECDPNHCNWMLFTAWMMMMLSMLKNTHSHTLTSHMMLSLSVSSDPYTYQISTEEIPFWPSIYSCMNFPYRFFQSCSILSFSLLVCLFVQWKAFKLLPKINVGICFTFKTMQTSESKWA